MIPKLTDEAISRLPLDTGRAELLEEIMSTVAPDRQTAEPTTPTRHRSRWLVPAAAAAVVAGIAASTLWWQAPDRGDGDRDGGGTPSVAAQPAGTGFRAVLDAPGWRVQVTETGGGDGSGEIVYVRERESLAISWYPADSYDSYVEDREHIVDPPAPGEPVEVLGLGGQLWAYSADDHTVIRQVQDGHWMEFRGTGMDQGTYLALLGQLRLVDLPGFEAALPDRFVTDGERADEVDAMLQAIEDASGAAYPSGRTTPPKSGEQDPYQLGAAVAGSYACAWLEEFQAAQEAGDQDRAAEAARVLGTSRRWPVLLEMNAAGDYPEAVWDYADQVAAGKVPEGYRGGLGCP